MNICSLYLKLRLVNKDSSCFRCSHRTPHSLKFECNVEGCGDKYEIYGVKGKCIEIKESKNEKSF